MGGVVAVKMVRRDGQLVAVPVSNKEGPAKKGRSASVGPSVIKGTAAPKDVKSGALKKKKVKPADGKTGTPAKAAAVIKRVVSAPKAPRASLRSKEMNRKAAVKKTVPRAATSSTLPKVLTDRGGARLPLPVKKRAMTPILGRSAPSTGRVVRAASGALRLKSATPLEPLRAAGGSAVQPLRFEPPRYAAPPPRIRETPDILTLSKIAASCDGRNSLPNGDVLKAKGFSGLHGFDLTGSVSYAELESFVKEFPEMGIISLYNCPALDGLVCLRKLLDAEILYLGELPRIPALMIKKLLAPGKREVWPKLREVHLAGMQVTDECLESLSKLPLIKSINVSSCPLLTARGLTFLEKNCASIRDLSIEFCPLIEPFAIEKFRINRRDVRVISCPPDPSIMELAVVEARERMAATAIRKDSLFFTGANMALQREKARVFYEKMFGLTGCPMPQEMSYQHIEQVLQSYKAHCDVAAAFCGELERQGHFSQESGVNIPRSVPEALILATQAKGRKLKVRVLDFSYSGLPFIPLCISKLEWEDLEAIDLRGTHIKGMPFIPADFLKKCPKLSLIRFDGCDQKITRG